MTLQHHHPHRPAAVCVAAGLLLIASLAQAAGLAPAKIDPLRLQFERERANCVSSQTPQPRDACLREAASAYAQARQGRLISPDDRPEHWLANALRRCQAQPQEDREMCERRVREGEVSGSVKGGGQLTTLTVRSSDLPQPKPPRP